MALTPEEQAELDALESKYGSGAAPSPERATWAPGSEPMGFGERMSNLPKRLAQVVANPFGEVVHMLDPRDRLYAEGNQVHDRYTEYERARANESWGKVPIDAAITAGTIAFPELAAMRASKMAPAAGAALETAGNLAAPAIDYAGQKAEEALGYIKPQDSILNLRSGGRLLAGLASFLPFARSASLARQAETARVENAPANAMDPATSGWGETSHATSMGSPMSSSRMGVVQSREISQGMVYDDEINRLGGVTFDPVTRKMVGAVPPPDKINVPWFHANLDQNINAMKQLQADSATVFDTAAQALKQEKGMTVGATTADELQQIILPIKQESERLLGPLAERQAMASRTGQDISEIHIGEATTVPEIALGHALDQSYYDMAGNIVNVPYKAGTGVTKDPYAIMMGFQEKETGMLSIGQVVQKLHDWYGQLRTGQFFDKSLLAKGINDPSAHAAMNDAYNKTLITATSGMRELLQTKANQVIANAGDALYAIETPSGFTLPQGFNGETFANASEYVHRSIPIKISQMDRMTDAGRATNVTQGRLITGGAQIPTSPTQALKQAATGVMNRWNTPSRARVYKGYDAQLKMEREASLFRQGHPEFHTWDIVDLMRHPAFLMNLINQGMSTMSPEAPQIASQITPRDTHSSIQRNVAAVDMIPRPLRAVVLTAVAGPLDGPALAQQESGLQQPKEKARFWSAVAKQFPMFPFASANTTGLSSEFDDGMGPKLWDDLDKMTWADTIQTSPLREDAKAQLVSALFRDGTVFPLEQAGELTQYPMQSPADQQQETVMKAISQSRRDMRTKEKIDLING